MFRISFLHTELLTWAILYKTPGNTYGPYCAVIAYELYSSVT